MSIPYEYTRTRLITKLHKQAVAKPRELLDCEDFSFLGKVGLLSTITAYFLFPIVLLFIYCLYIDTKNILSIALYISALIGNVWLLRRALDYFLDVYKKNLEDAYKNLPSSKVLLRVIKGCLIFTDEKGFNQGEISSFIDENLRSQVNFCKTTVDKFFAMANKIDNKNQ